MPDARSSFSFGKQYTIFLGSSNNWPTSVSMFQLQMTPLVNLKNNFQLFFFKGFFVQLVYSGLTYVAEVGTLSLPCLGDPGHTGILKFYVRLCVLKYMHHVGQPTSRQGTKPSLLSPDRVCL